MCLENASPKTLRSFAGSCFWGAHTNRCEEIITFLDWLLQAFSKHIQQKPFKNYCDHSPKAPKSYQTPVSNKTRPDILEKGKTRLEQWYYEPDDYLRYISSPENKNRKDRRNPYSKQRSQRREAVKLVGEVLLHYCDLVTLRIGWYDRTGAIFRPLSLSEIAKKAKIDIVRAKRALSDLVHSGYMTIQRRWDRNKDGDYIGLVSIRKLTTKFFTHLGFTYNMLELRRHWKRMKLAREGTARNPLVQRVLNKWESYRKRHSSKLHPEQPVTKTHEEILDEGAALCQKLKEENPHLSWFEIGLLASQYKQGP